MSSADHMLVDVSEEASDTDPFSGQFIQLTLASSSSAAGAARSLDSLPDELLLWIGSLFLSHHRIGLKCKYSNDREAQLDYTRLVSVSRRFYRIFASPRRSDNEDPYSLRNVFVQDPIKAQRLSWALQEGRKPPSCMTLVLPGTPEAEFVGVALLRACARTLVVLTLLPVNTRPITNPVNSISPGMALWHALAALELVAFSVHDALGGTPRVYTRIMDVVLQRWPRLERLDIESIAFVANDVDVAPPHQALPPLPSHLESIHWRLSTTESLTLLAQLIRASPHITSASVSRRGDDRNVADLLTTILLPTAAHLQHLSLRGFNNFRVLVPSLSGLKSLTLNAAYIGEPPERNPDALFDALQAIPSLESAFIRLRSSYEGITPEYIVSFLRAANPALRKVTFTVSRSTSAIRDWTPEQIEWVVTEAKRVGIRLRTPAS